MIGIEANRAPAENFNNTASGEIEPNRTVGFESQRERQLLRRKKSKGGGGRGQIRVDFPPSDQVYDPETQFTRQHEPPSIYSRDGATIAAYKGGYLSARNINFSGDLKGLVEYQRVVTDRGSFEVIMVGNEPFFKPAVDL